MNVTSKVRAGRQQTNRLLIATAVPVLTVVLAACSSGTSASTEESAAPAGSESAAPAASAAQAATYGDCKVTGEPGSITLTTIKDDTLIVGYTSLAPATYEGDTEETVRDGFNYCLAAEIANRAGLSNIELQKVDFAQLIVGNEAGFDIAIDDFYIKPERQEKVDFTMPYGHSWSGIAIREGETLTQPELKDKTFGVTLGSVQQKWLDESLKPTNQYRTYDSPVEMFAALKAKQIDVAAIDMPVALVAAAKDPSIEVVGQVKAGGEVGVILEKDSPNTAQLDTVVQELIDTGKLKENEKTYYYDAFGGVDPDSFPDWS